VARRYGFYVRVARTISLLYKRANDAVFDEFPKSSDHFPKISENFPKLFRRPDERFQTFSEHFQRFSEDCRRRPKEIRRCFDRTPINSTNSTKAKVGNTDVIERYDTYKGDTENTSPGSRMKRRMDVRVV